MLENKVAIITGGACGIGMAISELFVDKGARLAIPNYDSNKASTACATTT